MNLGQPGIPLSAHRDLLLTIENAHSVSLFWVAATHFCVIAGFTPNSLQRDNPNLRDFSLHFELIEPLFR